MSYEYALVKHVLLHLFQTIRQFNKIISHVNLHNNFLRLINFHTTSKSLTTISTFTEEYFKAVLLYMSGL